MACEMGRDFILSRRARLEMVELRDQLARVERVSLLGQLASALAHELAQPLSAISLNAGAARRHLNDSKASVEELPAIMDDIGRDGRRATEIIERMRQLFTQHAIEMRPLRVAEVVEDVVSLIRSEANSKGVAVSLRMQPGLPRVMGDFVHLSQVLLNLLMNSIHALEARPLDARHIVIAALVVEGKHEVEIIVRDSGPGISSTTVDEIFEPFFTTKPKGMGMGLAISRTIVKAHGGRLWADQPTPQEGAIFHFTLREA
jgi:signal transduction histidine kinase